MILRSSTCVSLLMGLLATVAAGAKPVYKCEEKGATMYTDRPCTASAPQEILPQLTVIQPPARTQRDLARRHDDRIALDRAARDRDDAEWLKQHHNRRDRERRVHQAIVRHKVIKSMTTNEVKQALGEPDHIDTGDSYGTAKETWTYLAGGERRTVNFKDGEVISTQRKGKRTR